MKRTIVRDNFLIGFKRLRYEEKRFFRREICFLVYDDKGCCGINALPVVFRMINKYEVTFFHLMNFIDPPGFTFLPDDLCTDQPCDLGYRNRFFKTHEKNFFKGKRKKMDDENRCDHLIFFTREKNYLPHLPPGY